MKADRLVTILLLLQAKGKVTTSRLAELLDVSKRTIHRDMEALSTSGIPIYAERGYDGGWMLSEGYRTNLTGLKVDELRALFLIYATSVVNDLGLGSEFDSAFIKLLASTPPAYQNQVRSLRERVHIDSTGWPQGIHSTADLPLLLKAVEDNGILIIDYHKKDKSEERTVFPLGLVAKGNIWYLVTQMGSHYRTFRVSNIKGVRFSGKKFRRPQSFHLQNYWVNWWENFKNSIPQYIVEIEVNNQQISKIKNIPFLRLLQTIPGSNEISRMQIDFETEEKAIRNVLSMGADAKVISPEKLRKKIEVETQKTLELYRK